MSDVPEGMQPPPPPPQQPGQPAPQPQMAPAGAISPDGKYRWDGTAWVPYKKMFLGDYANQSIVSGIIALLCAPFFLYGLYAGFKAYRELPHKRTLAIVGIVLNALLGVIWVIGIFARIAASGTH